MSGTITTTIGGLPPASTVAAPDLIPVTQGWTGPGTGTTRKMTPAQLLSAYASLAEMATFNGAEELIGIQSVGAKVALQRLLNGQQPVATTTNASSATMTGLAVMPSGKSLMRVTGVVVARNTTNGDASIWDVAAALKIVTGVPSLVGNASVSVFAQDASMVSAIVAFSAQSYGLALQVTGVAGAPLSWSAAIIAAAV